MSTDGGSFSGVLVRYVPDMSAGERTATAPRDKMSALVRCALASFVAGMLVVVVIFGLFAAGFSDLPPWISIAAITLTSVGFGLGLIALVREARRK